MRFAFCLLCASSILSSVPAWAGGSSHMGGRDTCWALLADGPMLEGQARGKHVRHRRQVGGSWRIATVSPEVSIADPVTNAERILAGAQEAVGKGANLVVFPEMAVPAYTAGDLLHTTTVRDGSRRALRKILDGTKDLNAAIVVGLPYEAPNGRYYNTAFVIQKGRVLGAVPKSYLPTYKEFYDERYVQSGRGVNLTVSDPLLGDFQLTTDQLFDFDGVTVAVEVCEDMWAPLPLVRRASAAGAKIMVNVSASNEVIAKAGFRRQLIADLSAQHELVYVKSDAGTGESTTDVVFGGHSMIASNGRILAEAPRFSVGQRITMADVDLDHGLHRSGDPGLFLRVKGDPIPTGAPVHNDRDAEAGVPIPIEAAGATPDAPVSGADWREAGFARMTVRRALGGGAPGTEVLVVDTYKEHGDQELRQLTMGHGAAVVRDGKSVRVVMGTDRGIETIPLVAATGEAPTKLKQFKAGNLRFAVVHELSEEGDIPVSTWHALAGATTIIVFADDDLDEKAKRYYEQQSARLNAAFLVVGRHNVIGGASILGIENGTTVFAATGDYSDRDKDMTVFDVDVNKLAHERDQNRTFGASPGGTETNVEVVSVPSVGPLESLTRRYAKTPFVPADSAELDKRVEEIFAIQAWGLYRRLLASGTQRVALGVSGGSDSTLAFLVYLETCKLAGWNPAEHIDALSMPGFGTTSRTRKNARDLVAAAGLEIVERDIRPAALQTLRDQNHPLWQAIRGLPYRGWRGLGRRVGDLGGRPLPPEAYYPYIAKFRHLQNPAFENAQARQRTLLLMQHAFVLGTGDMSELALGWATYNADHMAMYNPNTSMPKTLVKHNIRWYAYHRASEPLKRVLLDILATKVSPELLSPNEDDSIAQVTEDNVGPYVLVDFFLYHYVRNGFSARKIYELACRSFAEGESGVDAFSRAEVKKWLKLFFQRFFAQQYKRTVIPPGPKVGSVSLSSRGDWRMPDEASVRSELEGLENWP